MKKLRPAFIPNQEGYRLTGFKADGSSIPCIVKREPNHGMHFLVNEWTDERCYTDIVSWTPRAN